MQRTWTLYFILVLWLGLFVYSFFSTAGVEPLGDGFTRGLNRVGIFFKWHSSAFAFSIAALFLGWRQEAKGLRWLSRVPVLTHILAVVGTILVGVYFYQQEKQAALAEPETPITAPATEAP